MNNSFSKDYVSSKNALIQEGRIHAPRLDAVAERQVLSELLGISSSIKSLFKEIARKIPGGFKALKTAYGHLKRLEEKFRKVTPEKCVVEESTNGLRSSVGSDSGSEFDTWYDPVNPQVSIIVLNWSRSDLTLLCLREVWKWTTGYRYEVIVLDNWHGQDIAFSPNCSGGSFRYKKLLGNRFFGEANNIGSEMANGDILVFLENDLRVTAGWLEPLARSIEDSSSGIAGPYLIPSNKLYELQRLVSRISCAPDVPADPEFISGSCLAIKRSIFMTLNGFSLDFEPGYYEDVDLCLRLRKLGMRVKVVPSCVMANEQVQSGSTGGREKNPRLHDLLDLNWERLIAKHGEYIFRGKEYSPAPQENVPSRELYPDRIKKQGLNVGIYTPFDLTPGGGERYLLTVASLISGGNTATLVSKERWSCARIRQLGDVFGVPLDRVRTMRWDDAVNVDFDIFLSMANEAIPQVPAIGRTSFFHCQFPFPLNPVPSDFSIRAEYLKGYEKTIVNSRFTAEHMLRTWEKLSIHGIPISVLYPPCPGYPSSRKNPDAPIRILSVGRFFRGDHCKNHHLLVQEFKQLLQHVDAELHIAGSIHPQADSIGYFRQVQKMAIGLPVILHPNADITTLRDLYHRSHIYWHGTGMDKREVDQPETMEHFGISIVEAMSAGCVPVAFRSGGPAEIVEDGRSGFLFSSTYEIVSLTREIIQDPSRWLAMSSAAEDRSKKFSTSVFAGHLGELLGSDHFL